MIRRVILHIGLHKTGTTSFQLFIQQNPALFDETGIELYQPLFRKTAAANEIGMVLLRKGVIDELYPGPWSVPESAWDKQAWLKKIRVHLHRICTTSVKESLLISSEHLSFFRTAEEARSLRALFPDSVEEFKIVLVERDLNDWWRSYSAQIRRSGILEEKDIGPDYNSWAWLDRRGWLTDFDALCRVYLGEFGQITKLRFSENVIPQLLDVMGVQGYTNVMVYENRTPRRSGPKNLYKRWLSRTAVGAGWRGLKKAIWS